jgi:hypothetical protein
MSTKEYDDYCSFIDDYEVYDKLNKKDKDKDKKYYEGIATSFEEVKEWLKSIKMNKYIPNFKNNKVWNLEMVEGIEKKDLQEMGITKSRIINKFLTNIQSLKEKKKKEREEMREEEEEKERERRETEKRTEKVIDYFGLGKKMKRGKRRRKTRKKSKKRRKKSKKRRKKSKKRRKSRKKK